MEQRRIERLGRSVSVVGLGTWQLGADWGAVTSEAAHAVLEAAVDVGVTFIDTADVYGDGRSEQFCGELHVRHPEIFVATKMGRRVEQRPENYTREAFRAWNELIVGGVMINQVPTFRLENMPYGGSKDSGLGREGVRYAIEEMTELRTFVIKN